MRLNKRAQYGILLVLYICRSGRVPLEAAAENLKLSRSFLEQVARRLRIAGVVASVRGPGGGYELKGDPSVKDVLDALSPVPVLTQTELKAYMKGHPEHRALAQYATNLSAAIAAQTKRKVRNVGNELTVSELAKMNMLNIVTQVN